MAAIWGILLNTVTNHHSIWQTINSFGHSWQVLISDIRLVNHALKSMIAIINSKRSWWDSSTKKIVPKLTTTPIKILRKRIKYSLLVMRIYWTCWEATRIIGAVMMKMLILHWHELLILQAFTINHSVLLIWQGLRYQ